MSLVQLISLTPKQQLHTSKSIFLPPYPACYCSHDLSPLHFFLVKFPSLGHLQPLELRAVVTLLLPFKRKKESRRNQTHWIQRQRFYSPMVESFVKQLSSHKPGDKTLPYSILAWQYLQSCVLMQAPTYLLGLCASYLILQTLRT